MVQSVLMLDPAAKTTVTYELCISVYLATRARRLSAPTFASADGVRSERIHSQNHWLRSIIRRVLGIRLKQNALSTFVFSVCCGHLGVDVCGAIEQRIPISNQVCSWLAMAALPRTSTMSSAAIRGDRVCPELEGQGVVNLIHHISTLCSGHHRVNGCGVTCTYVSPNRW